MSDFEDADNIPSQVTIESALRNAVKEIYTSGKTEELTVNRVRSRVEEELGLPTKLLRNEDWKQRSHDVIHASVEQCEAEPAALSPPPKTAKQSASPKPRAALKQNKAAERNVTRGVKRTSIPTKAKPKKRRKVSSEEGSDEEDSDAAPRRTAHSDSEEEPNKPIRRAQRTVVEEDSDDEADDVKPYDTGKAEVHPVDEDDEMDTAPAARKSESPARVEMKGAASESELSDVIDEPPVKKKRERKEPAEKPAKQAKPKAKPTKGKGAKDVDPDEEEIKRLQGWLVKCGIRKVWSKELAKYDSPKAKVKHLKTMLKDAGMEGRFSIEKANRIKEKREFAADLEAIQEGAKKWGQFDSEEEGAKPRRRLARGTRKVNVVRDDEDDDDEEEEEE